MPPPVDLGAAASFVTRTDITAPTPVKSSAVSTASAGPLWTAMPPTAASTTSPAVVTASAAAALHRMAPWRIVGALALTVTFALMGWQVQRLVDDQPWSNRLMSMSVGAGIVVMLCVLGWTWITTDNAKRLVEPAVRSQLPDPNAAVRTWIGPFALIAVAVGVVAVLGARSASSVGPGGTDLTDATGSIIPVAVAVIALLLAVPLTYRPLNHLAAVVRQVGGYSVHLAQWMWVPVVMGVVGIGSIVTLRFAAVDDTAASSTSDTFDVLGWAPLWVVAVAAIAPCVVVVLLAWRAASSVEDAITAAASRRWRDHPSPGDARPVGAKSVHRRVSAPERTKRINLIPGAEQLRLVIVTLLAGAAFLSVVGAAATGLLWLDSRNTGVVPAERRRTWDTLEALEVASRGVTVALIAAVSVWTFVTVVNVRKTSSRRRNPLLAAIAWPAAAGAVWWIADRTIIDASIGSVVLGFGAQAAVLAVPFLLLERSADAVGARHTPLRIVYVLAVVLLVHVQGLGGLSRLPESVTTTEIGRLAGYLAIGALIQLCSTLAVTEACHAMSRACRHEADHHNMLVDQRTVSGRGLEPVAGR